MHYFKLVLLASPKPCPVLQWLFLSFFFPFDSFYKGLSVLCAVMKAMPCVRKCVLRSEVLSKRRPHTLQLTPPSPSSPALGEDGDPSCGDAPGDVFPPRLSCWPWRKRCVMNLCRLREPAEAKQAPHCRHCWDALSASQWTGMWRWNSSQSWVVKPQGVQRNVPSSSSCSTGRFSDARVLFAGPEESSPVTSSVSAPPPPAGAPPSLSSSDELPAPSPGSERFLVFGVLWEKKLQWMCG